MLYLSDTINIAQHRPCLVYQYRGILCQLKQPPNTLGRKAGRTYRTLMVPARCCGIRGKPAVYSQNILCVWLCKWQPIGNPLNSGSKVVCISE